ncbi:MAG: hypothetical protein KHX63_01550 [Veillonella sp.]|nr:hypothetical protein [Veillonella sp.]
MASAICLASSIIFDCFSRAYAVLIIVQTMLSIAMNLRHIAILSNNHITHFV